MKLYLPLLLICGGILPMQAEEKVRIMNVNLASGCEPIEVTTRSRITFSQDLSKMIVADGETSQTQSFDVDEIVSIAFTIGSMTKVDEADLDGLKISNAGKVLTITASDDIEYAVWDMSGTLITSGTANGSATIDFNTINAGVYIIKANQSTIKYLNH